MKTCSAIFLLYLSLFAQSKARLDMSLRAESDCKAEVTWKFSKSVNIGLLTLYRSYIDIEKLDVLDLNLLPITTIDLTDFLKQGTYTDTNLAHNCTYYYYMDATELNGGVIPSNVASITNADIMLPSLTNVPVSIYINKINYFLEVRRGDIPVKRYPMNLGSRPKERKLYFDQQSTPEGNYKILYANLHSAFYKSFMLDYPNAEDRKRYALAVKDGTVPLVHGTRAGIGGDITIHGGGIGNNWTWGCVAMRNEDIDELYEAGVFRNGTEVIICGPSLCPK